MATIAVVDYLALTDSIAAQVDLYKTSISGATGSAFFGADANLTRVLAFDEFEQESELLRGFEAQKRQMQLTGMAVPGWNASVRALRCVEIQDGEIPGNTARRGESCPPR